MLSTKFAYPLFHIKPVGKQMSISYYLVGWDVIDELDVVWKFLGGLWDSFVFAFMSSLLLSFGFSLLICSCSFANFRFNLLVFRLNLWYFHKRFELRFWTIWLSTLKEPSWVRIFIGRFELRIRTSPLGSLVEPKWVPIDFTSWVRIFNLAPRGFL